MHCVVWNSDKNNSEFYIFFYFYHCLTLFIAIRKHAVAQQEMDDRRRIGMNREYFPDGIASMELDDDGHDDIEEAIVH